MSNSLEEKEVWRIDSDSKADWAIQRIRERREEAERYIDVCEQRAEEFRQKAEAERAKCEDENAYLQNELRMYFETVKRKETKTQETYRLPSGTLKLKKEYCSMAAEDEALLMEAYPDYVKTTSKLQWGELKKRFSIAGNMVVDTDTGEIAPGVGISVVPSRFSVEV